MDCASFPVSSVNGRLLQSQELRITGIYLRNANLTGPLMESALRTMTQLKVLDLRNDDGLGGGTVGSNNTITFDEDCLDYPECSSATLQCLLPPSLQKLCSLKGQPTTSFPTAMVVGASVGGGLVLLSFILAYAVIRRPRRQTELPSDERRPLQPHKTLRSMSVKEHVSGVLAREMRSAGEVRHGGRQRSIYHKKSFTRKYKPKPDAKILHDDAWQEAFDIQTNTKYWVNLVTGEFSWSNPRDGDDEEGYRTGMMGSAASYSTARTTNLGAGAPNKSLNGWEEVYDHDSDTTYFVRRATGEFSRLDPKVVQAKPIQSRFVPPRAPPPSLWKEEHDPESGAVYRVDIESGAIVFSRPTEGTIIDPRILHDVDQHESDDAQNHEHDQTGFSLRKDHSKIHNLRSWRRGVQYYDNRSAFGSKNCSGQYDCLWPTRESGGSRPELGTVFHRRQNGRRLFLDKSII